MNIRTKKTSSAILDDQEVYYNSTIKQWCFTSTGLPFSDDKDKVNKSIAAELNEQRKMRAFWNEAYFKQSERRQKLEDRNMLLSLLLILNVISLVIVAVVK